MKKLEILEHVYSIHPKEIPFTTLARMKCQNCGKWKRSRDCPPYTPSVERCKEIVQSYDYGFVYVWKNDGRRAWREGIDKKKLVKKHDRGLKGCAIGMAIAIRDNMKEIREKCKKDGIKCRVFASGPCTKCRPCNVGGKCLRGYGIPAMEAWGIDVFGLLDELRVEYEYPVHNYLTLVSLLLTRRKEGV
jgi:predicted metal-binding protein